MVGEGRPSTASTREPLKNRGSSACAEDDKKNHCESLRTAVGRGLPHVGSGWLRDTVIRAAVIDQAFMNGAGTDRLHFAEEDIVSSDLNDLGDTAIE
jgi:hypothetical protein